jgi:hypothetical protein
MFHMDNSTPRRARESTKCIRKFWIHPIEHPPYSPDLVTFDFSLLGKPKSALAGQELDSTQ